MSLDFTFRTLIYALPYIVIFALRKYRGLFLFKLRGILPTYLIIGVIMSTTQENKIFSEADIAQLVELFSQGVTITTIAKTMERPLNNIRNKIRALQAKGKLPKRATTTTLSSEFITNTAQTYNVPIELVKTLAQQVDGPRKQRQQLVVLGCEAWLGQAGRCYYAPHISLTTDISPATATLMLGQNDAVVLVCRAIAIMRNKMSHKGFVRLCQTVARSHA